MTDEIDALLARLESICTDEFPNTIGAMNKFQFPCNPDGWEAAATIRSLRDQLAAANDEHFARLYANECRVRISLTAHYEAQLAAATEREAALLKMLQPFIDEANGPWPDDERFNLTVGDFRAARHALAATDTGDQP